MKRKFTFTILAMLFALMIPSAPTWGAEGDTHDFTQSISRLLNNNATIASISIPDQGYPVKQVNITCRYNKDIDPAVTINIAIGADNNWGTTTVGNNFNGTKQISGTSTPGNITISFTNNCGSGTGKGTFYVTNVQLVEGPAGSTPSITVNPSTITWDNSPINVQLSETISVSQANLTNNITIASTIGNVSLSTITAGEDATDVILTYTPTTTGDFEGTITFTSGEKTATVSVTGSAYDPSQVDTYELFTGDLVEGDYVIYYSSYAMTNTVANNRLQNLSVTPDNNAITNPDAAIVWHIAPSGNYWTIYSEAINKYAAGTTSKNQATLIESITDYAKWTVSTSNGKYEFVNLGRANSTSDPGNKYLRNNGTNGWACYASATGGALTLYKKAENKAATPTLTESQIFTTKPFEVTITNNEAGATVYYTTNGDNPTTETTTNFTGASTTININATTTVKAMAVVEGKANSEIASATYTEQKNDPENQWSAEAYTATIGGENTFPTFSTQSDGAVTYTSSNTNAATIDNTGVITLVAVGTTTITASTAETATYMAGNASYTLTVKEAPLATMDAIFEKATAVGTTATNVEVTFNNWVISGVKNNNAYLTDNNGKGLIIYTSNHGFEVGNILSGTITCKVQLYNGSAELTNLNATTSGLTVTTGGSPTPTEVSIANLSGVNTGAVIIASNVIYTGSDIFSDGENTIKAYNTFMALPSFTNGDRYNLTGVYIQYNTTREIAPRNAADIQLIVAAPTFTPEGGNYNAAQNVEIASATAGAAIYYTLDGSDPTVESTLYSAPIELTSNTTLKAIAAKAGSVSEIATAVYTITITTVATPTFEPEGGSYFNESLEVSLDCATNGATIVYTTDNWSTQTTYSNPFTITETTTVKAKATKAAMDDSEIAEATYTKRYKVDYVVNGDATAVAAVYVTPGEALGTLPTATAPNGYTFRGWSANEVALTNVEPTYVTAETVPTGDMTLKAVFAMAGTSGENALVKMVAGNTLNNGDKIVIVAHETTVALYQETVSSSYVNKYTFDNNFATIMGDDKNWLTVSTAEGGFTLGDATNGYLYSSGNNLYIGGTAQTWTLLDLANGTFKIQSDGRNLSYRHDLTNQYWRMGGASYGTSGQTVLGIYKISTSSTTYSNFCTTVSSPEIPAEIAGNVTIPSGAAYTLTSSITIKSGATLTVNGALGNTNASLLVIEDGGQLICGNEVSATVRKSISGYTVPSGEGADGWYIVSAPITDATASMAATGTYDLYTHDEAHYMWRNYQVTANQTTYDWFTSGYGYLYANAANTTLQFAGTVAAEGQKEVNLTCAANDATHGWNLLGNHTTHNIFFTGNNIEDGYYVMNAAGNAYESRLTSVPVAPCEGFFVKATSNTTVTLNPQPVSKSEEETPAIIETRVTETANANYSDVAYIVKGHGNNLTKISFGETTPSLFFAENGKDYAITHISDETEVLPLYFKASANANYTLNFNIDGEEFDYVVLNDMKTGAQIDLLENSSYSFDATTEDGENRFNIVFVASATESISENMDQPFAYRSGNEFIISSNGTLQIIDALGRVISTQAISGSARVNVGNLTQGTYIMRLIGDNTVRTQKVVVK